MAKKTQYEYKGSTHHFGPKPPKKDDGFEWIGAVIIVIIIMALLSTCS